MLDGLESLNAKNEETLSSLFTHIISEIITSSYTVLAWLSLSAQSILKQLEVFEDTTPFLIIIFLDLPSGEL